MDSIFPSTTIAAVIAALSRARVVKDPPLMFTRDYFWQPVRVRGDRRNVTRMPICRTASACVTFTIIPPPLPTCGTTVLTLSPAAPFAYVSARARERARHA